MMHNGESMLCRKHFCNIMWTEYIQQVRFNSKSSKSPINIEFKVELIATETFLRYIDR